MKGESPRSLRHIVAQGNLGQSDQIHRQDGKINYRPHQENISVIDEHRQEGAFEGNGVTAEPRGRHCRLFNETTQAAEAVEKASINWDKSKKLTQAVNEMYSIRMFDK